MVEIVTQARRENAQARIAILVRNRGHLREIVPQLKGAGQRFRAIEIEALGQRPVVQDLLALTRALSHPADRLHGSRCCARRGAGSTLADLHALAGDDGGAHGVGADERRSRASRRCPPTAARGCERVRAVLQACLEQRCRGSLRERVAGAWFALGGPACVEDTTDLEDAEIYFDYLESHEEAGEIADPAAFEEGLAKLYALPDLQADERLQIMTIHKAKGLEFDTVIVPGLGRRAARRRRQAVPVDGAAGAREDGATDLLLAPIQETGAEDDPIYEWLHKLDAEKERFEDGRLLYVAATRAARSACTCSAMCAGDRTMTMRPRRSRRERKRCSANSGLWSSRSMPRRRSAMVESSPGRTEAGARQRCDRPVPAPYRFRLAVAAGAAPRRLDAARRSGARAGRHRVFMGR